MEFSNEADGQVHRRGDQRLMRLAREEGATREHRAQEPADLEPFLAPSRGEQGLDLGIEVGGDVEAPQRADQEARAGLRRDRDRGQLVAVREHLTEHGLRLAVVVHALEVVGAAPHGAAGERTSRLLHVLLVVGADAEREQLE